jgi:hypothetical protein
MYMVQDAYHPAVFIYFVILVFLGPIFAIQLFLVVISTKFAETKESLRALEASKIASDAANIPPTTCNREGSESQSAAHKNTVQTKLTTDDSNYQTSSTVPRRDTPVGEPPGPSKPVTMDAHEEHSSGAPAPAGALEDRVMMHSPDFIPTKPNMVLRLPPVDMSSHSTVAYTASIKAEASVVNGSSSLPEFDQALERPGTPKKGADIPDHGEAHDDDDAKTNGVFKGSDAVGKGERNLVVETNAEMLRAGTYDSRQRLSSVYSVGSLETGADGAHKKKKRRRQRTPLQLLMYKSGLFAKSPGLGNFILGVIVINTIIMGIDHNCDLCLQSYCPKFKGSLEFLNVIFAAIFIGEAAAKIVGLGPWEYFTSLTNLFDFVIVIVSCIEIPTVLQKYKCLTQDTGMLMPDEACAALEACDSGGGGIMVLRTFRLVRIVKLLRVFPDIQKQVKIVVGILGSVAALIALILIFLLIFCILGMNVFGGTTVAEWDPSSVALGAAVYVQIPGDPLSPKFRGRYATVVEVDPFNHTATPWKVAIRYGDELHTLLNLEPDGTTWAQVVESASIGVPAIVAAVPRLHYDDLVHAIITTFEVMSQYIRTCTY